MGLFILTCQSKWRGGGLVLRIAKCSPYLAAILVLINLSYRRGAQRTTTKETCLSFHSECGHRAGSIGSWIIELFKRCCLNGTTCRSLVASNATSTRQLYLKVNRDTRITITVNDIISIVIIIIIIIALPFFNS